MAITPNIINKITYINNISWLHISWPPMLAFILTIIAFFSREHLRKRDMKNAIKNEIFSNSYELIDLKRVAMSLLDNANNYNRELFRIVYSPPLFNAFNSMISNTLMGSIKKHEKETYHLYALFREYDFAFKNDIENINNILIKHMRDEFKKLSQKQFKKLVKQKLDNSLYSPYKKICGEVIGRANAFYKNFNNKFVGKVDFLNKKEWKEYQRKMKASK